MVKVTIHHLIGEEDFKRLCPYCGRDVKPTHAHKWHSEFIAEAHYKTLACRCGKELRIKVDFHGSGHDNWNKKKKEAKKTIEDKIKEVNKVKVVKK